MADGNICEDKVMHKKDFNTALVKSDVCGYLYEPQHSELPKEEKEAAAQQPAAQTEPEKPLRLGDSWWCLCGNLTSMETEMESLCCNGFHRGQFLLEEDAGSEEAAV